MPTELHEMLFWEVMTELKEVRQELQSIKQELISLKVGRLDHHDRQIKRLLAEVENPKKMRSAIFAQVAIILLVTAFIWAGEKLYYAPSPEQQKIIYKLQAKKTEFPRHVV